MTLRVYEVGSGWLQACALAIFLIGTAAPSTAQMSSATLRIPASAFSGGGAVALQTLGGTLGRAGAAIGQAAPIGVSRNAGATKTSAAGLWPIFAAAAVSIPPTLTATTTATATATGGPTRTRTSSGSPVPTPTPTRTPTGGAARTATPTNTAAAASPTRSVTQSAASPTRTLTPTRTPTAVPGFYPRGDANCSVDLSAADVVAAARGVTGDTICGNDDCDRDGRLTAADVECAARCLFGECPSPPSAPRATAVRPVTAPGIWPFSVVLVDVTALAPEETLDRVTFNGVEADVIGREGTNSLRLIVPDVSPGPADVVVLAGDVGGPALRILVSAAQPIGAPDDAVGVLALVDQTAGLVLALNLAAAATPSASRLEGGAAVDLGGLIAAVRGQIQTFRDLAGTFQALLRDPQHAGWAALDRAVEASGLPERLKALVPDLVSTAIAERDKLRRAAEVYRDLSRFLDAAAQLKRTLDPAIAAVLDEARAELARVGVIVSDELRGLTEQSLQKLGIVLKVAFSDAGENARLYPTAGGRARVFYQRLGLLEVDELSVDFASGRLQLAPETSGDGFYDYRLPDDVGICGPVRMWYRGLAGLIGLSGLHTSIQPELLDLSTEVAASRDHVALRTRGVLGCRSEALFTRVATDPPLGRIIERATAVTAQSADGASASVPVVPPDRYRVTARVVGVASTEVRELQIQTAAQGLDVFCLSTQLFLPPASPSETSCTAIALPRPGDIPSEPDSGFVFAWQSAPGAVVELRDDDPTLADVRVLATHPGDTDLTVVAKTDREVRVAGTTNAAALHVADVTAPTVLLSTGAVDLRPGGFITVTANASDNDGLTRIVLTATGEAVSTIDFPTELPCSRGRSCSREWALSLKRGELFTDGHIRLRAETFDIAGNSGLSNTLEYVIEPAVTATPTATPAPTATGGPTGDVAYIGAGGKVYAVDTTNDSIVDTFTVAEGGQSPSDIEVRRDGSRAYVLRFGAEPGSRVITVLDLQTRQVKESLATCPGARELALRPDDAFLYVACFNDDRIDVVRTSTNTLERSIPLAALARPHFVASAPLGDRAWAIVGSGFAVVDTNAQALLDVIPSGNSPQAVAFSPDASRAYVHYNHYLISFDTATRQQASSLDLSSTVDGITAVDLVVTPDGRKLYVSNFSAAPTVGRVLVIDTAANRVTNTLALNQRAYRLALTRDGRLLYVTPNTSGTVKVVNTLTDAVIDELALSGATGIAIGRAP